MSNPGVSVIGVSVPEAAKVHWPWRTTRFSQSNASSITIMYAADQELKAAPLTKTGLCPIQAIKTQSNTARLLCRVSKG